MKRKRQSFRKQLDRFFETSRKVSPVDVEPALERLLERQRDNLGGVFESLDASENPARTKPPLVMTRPLWAASGILALVFAVTLSLVLWSDKPPAIVDSVDGGLYRVVKGRVQLLRVNEKLEIGETIHSNSGSGGVLVLADGSHVEMRSRSELSLDQVKDGIRIDLKNGSVIVSAAKQPAGRRLYVRTMDITVSVVGTVFLVNAEAEGSHVAVIEGEVRVQQGGIEQRLRSGEQVTTNPKMESIPVKEELTWSRQANQHVAMLEQTTTVRTPQAAIEDKVKFDVTSVRASVQNPGTGSRGGGGRVNECGTGPPQINQGRFAVTRAPLYKVITLAYFGSFGPWGCRTVDGLSLLQGGPGWIRTDPFEIEGTFPEGSFSTTPAVSDPKLQRMLQRLLADRFNLVVRREKKETPVYLMTFAGDASKIVALKDGANWLTKRPADWPWDDRQDLVIHEKGRTAQSTEYMGFLTGANASMADLAPVLGPFMGRPVLDRTGVASKFSYFFNYVADSPPNNSPLFGPLNPGERASLMDELEKQLGLKFEASKDFVEVLVIDSVDKPTEN
jgi:uncharacterized protein (TIGR03435 family)